MNWNGNDQVFKTYVRGNGKKPSEAVKGRDFISEFKDVRDCNSFGGLLSDGYVDISFDDTEMYEKFLDMAEENDWRCLCLPSGHGGHTYWKKPEKRFSKDGKDKHLAVGFLADVHSKSTYIPLKVNGLKRFPPDYDIQPGETYQEVPEELFPVFSSVNLWKMDVGEGRNDNLFRYILDVQKLHLPVDTMRRILINSNKFVFSKPLDDNELNIIMRDEAFQKPQFYDADGKFLHAEFGDYLIQTEHVAKLNGQLHVFRDGVYIQGEEPIEQAMITLLPTLRYTQRVEVIRYLRLVSPEIERSDARYIAFKNGIYDLVTDSVVPYSPDIVVTNKINLNYDPEIYDQLADDTLNAMACDDPSIRALLEECVGYCFYRRNEEMRKAFILTGGKRNGKSTFLSWLKDTLGEENISALDLSEVGERFSTAMLFGKLANIGDDIGDDFLQGSQVSVFKKIVAGNRVKAEWKGQNAFEFNPYVKLLFSANDIPRMKDKTGAVLDRLIIIPFDAKFEEGSKGFNKNIYYELKEETRRMYLVRVGIEGLKRIYAPGATFTKSDRVQKQLDQYDVENNPIVGFLMDTERDEIVHKPVSDVFAMYEVYCNKNGMNRMGASQFAKVLTQKMHLVSKRMYVNGKQVRVFEEE